MVHAVHQLKLITPIVTIRWPTLSIKNWVQNKDYQTENQYRIINKRKNLRYS